MANVDNAHGFIPLMRSIVGGPGAALMAGHKIAGSGTALFKNDVVKLGGSGTKSGLSVVAGTAGAAAVGVNLNYGAVSTATDHLIIPGHLQVFEAQIDTISAAGLNQNCQLVATAGNATTQQSKHSLNNIATTNTHEFRVLKLWDSPDNAVGAYARVEVTFIQSEFADQIAGV
jgi:hypothetical protein